MSQKPFMWNNNPVLRENRDNYELSEVTQRPSASQCAETDSFRFVDAEGTTLRADSLYYAYPTATDYDDANWLRCRISLSAVIGNTQKRLEQSVDGYLTAPELQELIGTLQALLDTKESTLAMRFEPMESHITLELRRDGRFIEMDASLDLCLGRGPTIEANLRCRLGEIEVTLGDLRKLAAKFPVRGL